MKENDVGEGEGPPEATHGSPRLIWLQAFVAVCNHGSFAAAGRSLRIGESDIRKYVSHLESWLSKKLFFRKPSLRISPDGSYFLPLAQQVIDIMYTAQQQSVLNKLLILKGINPDDPIGTPFRNSVLGTTTYEID